MAEGMTLIQSIINTSSAATITFSSIPQTYSHLCLIYSLSTSDGAWQDMRIRPNGDSTSANFKYRGMSGYMSGASNAAVAFSSGSYDGLLADYEGMVRYQGDQGAVFYLFNYTSTTDYKLTISRSTNQTSPYYGVDMNSSLWRSTAAVNSLTVAPGSVTPGVGSFCSLYGIKGA
mgnify:CR=1 FL=1